VTATLALALAAAIAWAVLLLGRGMFWLARDDDRDAARLPAPNTWPSVVCVIPARIAAAADATDATEGRGGRLQRHGGARW
jgi:FAD/FMN-containing dehydrogenase